MNIITWITSREVSYWNLKDRHILRLKEELPGTTITCCKDADSFLRHLPEAHIALVWRFQKDWLPLARQLRWIVTPAAGRDYFFVPPDAGIELGYCSFHGEIMAETVVGMILAETRGLRKGMQLQQAGEQWPRDKIWPHMKNLRGSRVTILGFGHIGSWIGRLLKPFGVNIIGVKREVVPAPAYFTPGDAIITPAGLAEVLPGTEHLVLALPSGSSTDGFLDAGRLALLPAGAAVYNVGRGNAIEEEALLAALRSGRLAAAYLDVFREEPLTQDSPLRQEPNICILPHASAMAPNYMDLFVTEFVAKYKKKYSI